RSRTAQPDRSVTKATVPPLSSKAATTAGRPRQVPTPDRVSRPPRAGPLRSEATQASTSARSRSEAADCCSEEYELSADGAADLAAPPEPATSPWGPGVVVVAPGGGAPGTPARPAPPDGVAAAVGAADDDAPAAGDGAGSAGAAVAKFRGRELSAAPPRRRRRWSRPVRSPRSPR